LFRYHPRETENLELLIAAEFRAIFPIGIPWNSGEFNANSDGSSAVWKQKLGQNSSTGTFTDTKFVTFLPELGPEFPTPFPNPFQTKNILVHIYFNVCCKKKVL
jgi:hypothetical protein